MYCILLYYIILYYSIYYIILLYIYYIIIYYIILYIIHYIIYIIYYILYIHIMCIYIWYIHIMCIYDIIYIIIYLCCTYTQDQISRISPAQTGARLSSWRFPAGKSQLKSQVYLLVNHRKMEVYPLVYCHATEPWQSCIFLF